MEKKNLLCVHLGEGDSEWFQKGLSGHAFANSN